MQLDILDRPVAFAAEGRVAGPRAQALFADAQAMAADINALADRLTDKQIDTCRLARQQLDVAGRCQCDSALIGFLEGYATDRDKIAERLRQGVGFNARLVPHFAIL